MVSSIHLSPLTPGTRAGTFEIVALLSQGGQAQTYIARRVAPGQRSLAALQRRLRGRVSPALVAEERLCVLKLALPGWGDGLSDEHSYLISARSRHPRLVRLFSDAPETSTSARRARQDAFGHIAVSASDGTRLTTPYLALDYEPGGTLKDLLRQRSGRRISPSAVVAIATQVAEALLHLHTQLGLVHHDVTPGNIVLRHPLRRFGPTPIEVVLIDLAVADAPAHPRMRRIYGNRRYLPPERLVAPPAPLDWSIDVYSLGVTLYELLAGRLPVSRTTSVADIPPLPRLTPPAGGPSPALINLVMAMVSHDPSQRPSLASALAQLRALPDSHRRASLDAPWTWRSALTAGTLGGAASLLLAVGIALTTPPTAPLPSPAKPTLTLPIRPTRGAEAAKTPPTSTVAPTPSSTPAPTLATIRNELPHDRP